MDELITRAKAGDDGAWRQIVAALGPSIQGYSRAKGVPEPEDTTQDVFVDVARALSGFEGTWSGFRSWVFTIAYRRIADVHRRRYRSPDHVAIDEARAVPDATDPIDERLDRVLGALEGLSPLERDIVLLRVVGEFDSAAVGEIVGKSAGNVRVIQNRALHRLRENLGAHV